MAAPPTPGTDPSMDEILASIRKILNEDETKAAAPPITDGPPPPGDVLLLDETMIVSSGIVSSGTIPRDGPAVIAPPPPAVASAPATAVAIVHATAEDAAVPILLSMPLPGPEQQAVDPPQPSYSPMAAHPPNAEGPALVGPAAAGAAGASVETLIRTLARERTTATHRGGPTIEDLVRDEMRPLLREWLDTHLPPLVERLVRAEIERVVNRTGT